MKTSPTAPVQRGLNVQVLMTTTVSTSQWWIKLQRLATRTTQLWKTSSTTWHVVKYCHIRQKMHHFLGFILLNN